MAALVFAWAAFWARFVCDDLGGAAHYLWSRRVEWQDVDEVMLHRRWGVPALVLHGEGGSVTVWAIAPTVMGSGLSYCRKATREVQATWSRSNRPTDAGARAGTRSSAVAAQ